MKNESKFDQLDAAIIDAIKGCYNTSTLIFCYHDIASECEYLANPNSRGSTDRVLNRRLQALRKAGKITYKKCHRRWVLVEAK
jgi:hypothetical protein